MTTLEIETFSFEIYNSCGNGILNKHELHDVLEKIHGKHNINDKLQAVIEIMDVDHSKGIDIDEYLVNIKKFPVLVFPVFAIQVIIK